MTHAGMEKAAIRIADDLEREGFTDREVGILLGLVSKHFHHPAIKRRPPTIGEQPKAPERAPAESDAENAGDDAENAGDDAAGEPEKGA